MFRKVIITASLMAFSAFGQDEVPQPEPIKDELPAVKNIEVPADVVPTPPFDPSFGVAPNMPDGVHATPPNLTEPDLAELLPSKAPKSAKESDFKIDENRLEGITNSGVKALARGKLRAEKKHNIKFEEWELRDPDVVIEKGKKRYKGYSINRMIKSHRAKAFSIDLSTVQILNPDIQVLQDGRVVYRGSFEIAMQDKKSSITQEAVNNDEKILENLSQYSLGKMYKDGKFVEKDYIKALDAFKKSAEYNNPLADYELGLLYVDGLGTLQDYNKAAAHFLASASKGISEAQFRVGSLFASGQGVGQDFSRAYAWYSIAASNGHVKAKENRDTISTVMEKYQLKQARKLAKKIYSETEIHRPLVAETRRLGEGINIFISRIFDDIGKERAQAVAEIIKELDDKDKLNKLIKAFR